MANIVLTKFNIFNWSAAFFSFWMSSSGIAAQNALTPTVQAPGLIVIDSSVPPKLVGVVAGYNAGWHGFPYVVLRDVSGDVYRATVTNLTIFNHARYVYFSNVDCTGTAYLSAFDPAATENLAATFEEMAENSWAMGPPASSGTLGQLYKSTGTLETATIQSYWAARPYETFDCFASTNGDGELKYTATAIDLDATFSPPFKFR